MSSLNRRQFVEKSVQGAIAAGTVAAMSRSAFALANDTLSVAIIGCGGRCRAFLDPLLSRKDAAITALCDPDENRLGELAAALEKSQGRRPAAYADYRKLLDDGSIDVCFIATPHHQHSPIAVPAVIAGKDVYVEKPASHVFREGRLLVDAAKKHGRIVQHGTQMRSSEVTAKAGEVLASDLLGKIKIAKAWNVQRHSHRQAVPDSSPPKGVDYDVWLGPAPNRPFNANRFHGNWQWYRDYGNGDIGNDGVHDIDMARFGLGVSTHPVRITAHGSRIDLTGEREYPDNMLVAYQYADDKVLIYEDRGFTPYGLHGYDSGNAFYGTEGYMIFTRRGFFEVRLGRKEEPGPTLRGGTGMPEHVMNFLECVRSRKEPNASAEIAHLTCGLVHLGEIAYRVSRVLEFDPATETIKGDAEAAAMLTKEYRAPWRMPEKV
ncbi:MAG: Gfo/Idh/MocA family oxidoreductase [Planctomycetia bacterium]|nr:Gfo/Idh/MocA family oxidoreductase [Planctomycetia bacterium]